MLNIILTSFLVINSATLHSEQQVSPQTDDSVRQRTVFAVNQLPDQIKSIDEPAIRIFLRLRLANHLVSRNVKEIEGVVESIIADALNDLESNEKDLPDLYANMFRRDLMALAKLHAPGLVARFEKQNKPEQANKTDEFGIAYSLLDSKEGVAPAIETIYRAIKNGRNLEERLIYFLSRLEADRAPQLPQMLVGLLMIEEQNPGAISARALLSLLRFYLKDDTPTELKARYLSVSISVIETSIAQQAQGSSSFSSQTQLNDIYLLLENLIPRIETTVPQLYPRARSLMASLTPRIPQAVLDRDAMRARVNQSTDPLNQLIIEADTSTDESVKGSLYIEAAQLALSKDRFKMAADIVPSKSIDPNFGLWHDQFLSDVVRGALDKKDSELANYGASKITSPVNRAYALRMIALYFFNSKDTTRARETMNEAVKLLDPLENRSDKAIALLSMTGAFTKVDEVRVPEMALAAIKVINNIPQPKIEDRPDSDSRKAYRKSVLDIAWSLIPIFQHMVVKDEIGTFNLASGLQRPEFKATALFGSATGVIVTSKDAVQKAKQ